MEPTGWKLTSEQFTRYLLSSGKAPNTAKTYASNLLTFWQGCGRYEVTPYEADKPLIRAWISERLGCVSSNRAHNDLAALKHFYAWLRETRYRDDDPTQGIRVKRTKALPTKPLDRPEVDALLTHCNQERDRLIILLLAHTGIRISELSCLSAEDIDWRKGLIKIRGKGDKERELKPHPDVLGRLHAFCGMFPTGPIFVSRFGQRMSAQALRKTIYSVAERAKVDGVHPHRFRAFFATEFIEEYADIQALQGNLGHESIATTARYSEYTRNRRAQDMMSRLKLTS